MTKTLMPCFTAFEAHSCPACTHRFVFATTRFPDCVFAVWARAPFYSWVLSNLNITLDAMIQFNVFFFAKILHLLLRKVEITALFHAADFENFARLDARLQILFYAGRATLVTAFKCEDFVRQELVADWANRICVWTLCCWLMLSS